jgi:hypothetical protein
MDGMDKLWDYDYRNYPVNALGERQGKEIIKINQPQGLPDLGKYLLSAFLINFFGLIYFTR